MRAHYVEYVIEEQTGFTLWRTLLCERAYERARVMPNSKIVEALNSNPNLPKVRFVTDLFITNSTLPCGALRRCMKVQQINRMKRWSAGSSFNSRIQ